MKKVFFALSLSSALAFSVATVWGDDDNRGRRLRATLTGYEEVPMVSTVAAGRFRGTIAHNEESFTYSLTFNDLQGVVTQSHIHAAQKSVNGAIVVWLCQTDTNPAPAASGAVPMCPAAPGGTVTGEIDASNVVANAPTQQLTAGELDEVIAAMRAGTAYVNVHSSLSGGGEIRGQIRVSGDRD